MKQNGKSVATKRKQLSLDALLPKKTIKTSHQQPHQLSKGIEFDFA